MSNRPIRLAAFGAVAVSVALVPSAHAARHGSGASVRAGIYDCYYSSGGLLYYLDSYQFKSGHRYGLGARLHGNRLQGKVDWGRYRMRGKRVIPTNGPLKKNRYYMVVKNRSEVVLMHDSHKPTGVGCYRH